MLYCKKRNGVTTLTRQSLPAGCHATSGRMPENTHRTLSGRKNDRLATIRMLYEQQKYMYDHRCHTVPDRIVSVGQPFLRPIVRGKAGKPVEFGAKLDISVVGGWTRLECFSFDAYNEAGNLAAMAERFREREGHYPSQILADKIYRNRENLRFCKERGIRLSGPALGRPKKDEVRNKTQDFLDECERVEVERRFSLDKRKCGLGLIVTKLRETIAHSVAMSVLVLNLRKMQRALLRLLALFILLQQFQLRQRITSLTKPAANITYRNSLKRLWKSVKQRVDRPGFDLSQNSFQL